MDRGSGYITMNYFTRIIFALLIFLSPLGCRDIVVNVPSFEQPGISGTWEGDFGAYNASGQETSIEEEIRRRDSIRLSVGITNDRYAVHGIWEISVYSYIEQGFSSARYPFSSSMIDVGNGKYSMRLYINQGSAIYEMWLDGDELVLYRPDTGYYSILTKVQPQ